MTPAQIRESRAICDAATFDVEERAVDMPYMVDGDAWWYVRATDGGRYVLACSEEDAVFYAHARTALPAALDEIERLNAHASLVETLEKQATEMCSWLTKENQRLRDVVGLSEHLDAELDELMEDAEDDCVSRVIAENDAAKALAEIERLKGLLVEACDIAVTCASDEWRAESRLFGSDGRIAALRQSGTRAP